jgi:hypothetical protein
MHSNLQRLKAGRTCSISLESNQRLRKAVADIQRSCQQHPPRLPVPPGCLMGSPTPDVSTGAARFMRDWVRGDISPFTLIVYKGWRR